MSFLEEFKKDVIHGLSQEKKTIPSKYFYDYAGSALFQQIMSMKEYYLTRSELEILSQQGQAIWQKVYDEKKTKEIHLIELGAGDGLKTAEFMKAGIELGFKIHYHPIDISNATFEPLRKNLPEEIDFQPVHASYFDGLDQLKVLDGLRLTLFLGSNIGNMNFESSKDFMGELRKHTSKEDLLLLGADLRKAPSIIIPAYNDSSGITKQFNFNLLNRINRELKADIHPDNFEHFPTYDLESGEMRSYFISLKEQQISIDNQPIKFDLWEPIHIEISKKFNQSELIELAQSGGFSNWNFYLDCKHYFADMLCY